MSRSLRHDTLAAMMPVPPSIQPIEVVCIVLVDPDLRFLATQRPIGKALAGHWEFPGGKVEPGEPYETALRRELKEELQLEVGALAPLSSVTHVYDFGTIRLVPFLSRCIQPPEINLLEHAAQRWVSIGEANSLRWAPADLPILRELFPILRIE